MREIKFRAWDKTAKKMCFVDALYQPLGGVFRRADLIRMTDGRKYSAEVHAIELMQFTGLTDKNGKEIYEGDILKIGDQFKTVVWNTEYGYADLFAHYRPLAEDYEIVGNIYENPTILE